MAKDVTIEVIDADTFRVIETETRSEDVSKEALIARLDDAVESAKTRAASLRAQQRSLETLIPEADAAVQAAIEARKALQ